MITRRSINKAKVPAIRTLRDYLDEQDQLLDSVMKILNKEYRAIKERKIEQL